MDSYNKETDLEFQQNLDSLSADLSSWLDRAKATNSLFDYITDTENTKLQQRLRAMPVIKDIVAQTSFLASRYKLILIIASLRINYIFLQSIIC